MKLKTLSLKNIRSYREEKINFPEGSLMLAGDVGSGKTSILLAVEYALFGLQPGQKGSALLRNNRIHGEVKLELEIKEQPIKIERRLKRTEKGVRNEYASVTINGEKEELSITEIKTKILDLLGYPPEFIRKNNLLYRYTVFTPQEQMKEIITEDQESRLNIIRHIFGIDKYKRIRENLVLLLNTLKEDSKFLQGEIKSLDEEKENLKLKKESTKSLKKIIALQKEELNKTTIERENKEKKLLELESKIKEKETLEKEVEKTSILLRAKNENLSNLNREELELKNSLEEEAGLFNEENYKKLLYEITISNQKLESLNSKYAEITSSISSIDQIRQENLKKKSRIFKIDICPTCLQNVSETHKHNILNETEVSLSKIKNKTTELEKEKIDVKNLFEKEKSNLSMLEEEKLKMEILKSRLSYLEKLRKKIQELEKTKKSLLEDISLLEKHTGSLKSSISTFSKFFLQIKKNQQDLVQAKISERKAEISLAESKKELELTGKEVEVLEYSIEKKEKSKKKLSTLLELNDWLSSKFSSLIEFTEQNILMSLRMRFSKLFSKWFNMLVETDSLQVKLDETFSPIIIQKEVEMEYSFLSGGERTAVALAYRLALNQTINSILSKIQTKNLVILDEPTDGFSETQIDKIRGILEELNVAQLIVVSHEQKIEGFVDNVIRIKKHDEVSSVVN